jgi:putative ABC transport system ATP-binding protein
LETGKYLLRFIAVDHIYLPMLQLINLQKKYRTDEVETTALHQVNLEVRRGEFVAIMGPSGCGKSTLMNMLGLLDSPSGGQLYFKGQDVSGFTEKQRAGLRKANIGFIFQSFNLIDNLTVYSNIELPLLFQQVPVAERNKRVGAALAQMQLAHRQKHYPAQLSGGQQQRVAIARAVVTNPSLILADEPTGNLDSATRQEVMRALIGLNEAGTTIVMVTHSPTDAGYSHRIVRLFDGTVVTEQNTSNTYAQELL